LDVSRLRNDETKICACATQPCVRTCTRACALVRVCGRVRAFVRVRVRVGWVCVCAHVRGCARAICAQITLTTSAASETAHDSEKNTMYLRERACVEHCERRCRKNQSGYCARNIRKKARHLWCELGMELGEGLALLCQPPSRAGEEQR
jgi:hypothetical protein